jgi:hypothetical protein
VSSTDQTTEPALPEGSEAVPKSFTTCPLFTTPETLSEKTLTRGTSLATTLNITDDVDTRELVVSNTVTDIRDTVLEADSGACSNQVEVFDTTLKPRGQTVVTTG